MRLRLFPLTVVLAAGCVTVPRAATPPPPQETATAPAPPPAPAVTPAAEASAAYLRPDVVKLRDEAKALLQQQGDLFWKSWTASAPLDVAATYEGHDHLFSADTLKTLRDARQSATGESARALEAFELYIAGEIVAKALAPASDELAWTENQATLPAAGSPAYRQLDQLLAGEASADQRAKLYGSEMSVIVRLEPLIQRRQELADSSLKSLGYPSYGAYSAALRGIDLDRLAELAEQTLKATDELYSSTMDKLTLDELALPLAKVRRSDLPRLFRTQATDTEFPASRMLAAATAVFQGLGLDLGKQAGLKLSSDAAGKGGGRTVCLPVNVPNDVRLWVHPVPGAEAYRSLLFELALAQQDVHNTRPEWEFQVLGSDAASNAFAVLFQDLVDDPAWLATWPGLKHDTGIGLARRAAALRLYLTRRNAGRLQFEALLYSGRLTEPPENAYRRLMSRACGFPLTADDARRAVTDRDDFLGSATWFEAWILAAQIHRHLTKTFGPRWWESPGAGQELSALWTNGHALTADDVARWAGGAGLDPAQLSSQLAARLTAK